MLIIGDFSCSLHNQHAPLTTVLCSGNSESRESEAFRNWVAKKKKKKDRIKGRIGCSVLYFFACSKIQWVYSLYRAGKLKWIWFISAFFWAGCSICSPFGLFYKWEQKEWGYGYTILFVLLRFLGEFSGRTFVGGFLWACKFWYDSAEEVVTAEVVAEEVVAEEAGGMGDGSLIL